VVHFEEAEVVGVDGGGERKVRRSKGRGKI
jgi:hypothetical protein